MAKYAPDGTILKEEERPRSPDAPAPPNILDQLVAALQDATLHANPRHSR